MFCSIIRWVVFVFICCPVQFYAAENKEKRVDKKACSELVIQFDKLRKPLEDVLEYVKNGNKNMDGTRGSILVLEAKEVVANILGFSSDMIPLGASSMLVSSRLRDLAFLKRTQELVFLVLGDNINDHSGLMKGFDTIRDPFEKLITYVEESQKLENDLDSNKKDLKSYNKKAKKIMKGIIQQKKEKKEMLNKRENVEFLVADASKAIARVLGVSPKMIPLGSLELNNQIIFTALQDPIFFEHTKRITDLGLKKK
ncbi:MAG TPA: hypothetical protein VEK38_02690 [Candidatus Bathyarchaeia archaeon]|nr:hypothetical protein [Candidatus Bathyarchaeia archaeon]